MTESAAKRARRSKRQIAYQRTPAGRATVRRAQKAWLAKGGGLWSGMKQRCYNPKHPKFYLYGELGVEVCDRWRHSFPTFISDMGPRPSLRHSIDRYPDPFGDYEPDNCRWATDIEQRHNRRDSSHG